MIVFNCRFENNAGLHCREYFYCCEYFKLNGTLSVETKREWEGEGERYCWEQMRNGKNCVLCSRSSTLKSMRSLIKLGKQRPPRARSCDSGSDTSELLDRRDSSCATSNEPSRTNSMTSLETNVSDYDSQGGVNTTDAREEAIVKPTKKSKPKVRSILWIRLTLSRRIFLPNVTLSVSVGI